ncbi:MAG: hypothetical protein E7574_02080 [Ruminococcaceae bacterium]|nr:hypothetical protein [Oscillospiraceae bacterium]
MGISYLIAGFVFFFLPNLSIIDLMPDFIGCILIMRGLYKLADLTPGLMIAKNAFKKALYVYLAKFVLMFTAPYFGNTNGSFLTIFSFVFFVLELIYVLPAFKALLDGFLYLGNRTESSVLFLNQSEFSTLTSIFIFVKSALPLLADFSYISTPEYSNNVTSGRGFYLSDYRTLLVVINLLVTGIIGVVWLYYALRYFKGIKNDTKLISHLDEQYRTTVLPNEGLFIRRSVSLASSFLMISGIFAFDVFVDSVNILPDFLSGLFIVFISIFLKKYCNTKLLLITSVIYTVFSAISWGTLCYFAVKFPAVYIWNNFEAYELFMIHTVANAIKYISCIIVFVALFKTLKEIIIKHSGTSINELKSISRFNSQMQKYMIKLNNICLILGIICCVSGIIRIVLLYDFAQFMLFDYAFNFIWYIYLSKLLTSINETVEYKYL